jgi:hypothetical protein
VSFAVEKSRVPETYARVTIIQFLHSFELSHFVYSFYCILSRTNWWAEPEASSFRVRGKTYKSDNTKEISGPSLFRLFAADIVESDIPIMTGMCSHPKERVQLAKKREREALSKIGGTNSASEMPAFVFVVSAIRE